MKMPHARLLGDPRGRLVSIDAGYLHGSEVGGRVEFYPGLDELQDLGLIGPFVDGKRRDILLSSEEWLELTGRP